MIRVSCGEEEYLPTVVLFIIDVDSVKYTRLEFFVSILFCWIPWISARARLRAVAIGGFYIFRTGLFRIFKLYGDGF